MSLIPSDGRSRPEFVCISGHGFVHDNRNRLYTVYIIEMQCNGSKWIIYRRYREFKKLHDQLKDSTAFPVPDLPCKKIFGSFSLDFIQKRQADLAEWLKHLLSDVPQLADLTLVQKFLTFQADQSPFPLERVQLIPSAEPNVPEPPKASLNDFKMLKVIGKGSFGQVVLVRHLLNDKLYAMKILTKRSVIHRKQVQHTQTERRVLGYTDHPFIVQLHFAFQTSTRLFFILEYCPGGELFYHLARLTRFPLDFVIFYAAQLTLALEHLHGLGVAYRDLKPENILLDADGHIKLADFGLAKEGMTDTVHGSNSLCGTPEYLPPEIIDRIGHGTSVDWWNLGMVVYEMLTGLPPWYTHDREELFQRLRHAKLKLPAYLSPCAQDFIRSLLVRDPVKRLGSTTGATEVKSHEFFRSIDWTLMIQKRIPAPFHPTKMNLNFDQQFTTLPLPSVDEGQERAVNDDIFTGFSFQGR